jgi:predicted dienelactone hydrolase
LLVAVLAASIAAPSARSADDREFNVGLRVLDFAYTHPDGRGETVTAALWYPTHAQPHSYTYAIHTRQSHTSQVAIDAPVAAEAGPYPLVLFAHGGFGCGHNSAFFTEYLARHGYVVVAPDYVDAAPPAYERQVAFSRIRDGTVLPPLRILAIVGRFARDMSADRERFLAYLAEHRFRHTSFVIDRMLELSRDAASPFPGAIREDAIGICGHSEGGITVLGKIGPHPEAQFRDERIKATLVFSAPAYPFQDTMKSIAVPLMLMAGENDLPGLHPELQRRMIYDEASPPKYYLVLKDGTHFSFGNGVCGNARLCDAVETNVQARAICRYGLAFFERYVRRETEAARQLQTSDPAWAYYVNVDEAGEAREFGTEPPPPTGGPAGLREELRRRWGAAPK